MKNKSEIINKSRYIVLTPSIYFGKWTSVFNNDNPIYIEIGMGKGDFILENARQYPNINFIGIEKNDSIMALAIKKIEQEKFDNLKLICMDALNILDIFKKEIDKVFLNFSDPWPKERHAKRRLTSPVFLDKYISILKKDGVIEMKTDNKSLFEYSLISFNNCAYQIQEISLDLHNSTIINNIMTEYEKKFSIMNKPIYYVKVQKNR